MSKTIRWLALAIVLLVVSVPASYGQVERGQWLTVKIEKSSLEPIAAEERLEQLRDWALVSAAVSTGQKQDTYRDVFYRYLPVRLDLLHPLFQQRAGENRWIGLPDGVLLAIVPEGKGTDLLRLGRLADEYTIGAGTRPKKAIVFEYRADAGIPTLALRRAADIAGTTLYSSAAGYLETVARRSTDLSGFLSANVDLVEVTRRPDGLGLGGRRFDSGIPQLISLADIAAILGADSKLIETLKDNLRIKLPRLYEERVNEAAERIVSKDPTQFGTASFADLQRLRALIRREVPYDEFESKQIDSALSVNPPAIGFSLDPRQNYAGIARDLDLFLDHPKQLSEGPLLSSYAKDLQSESQTWVHSLEERLAKTRTKEESEFGPEESALTLIGLEKTTPQKTSDQDEKVSSLVTALGLSGDESIERARHLLDEIAIDAKTKREPLRAVVSGLRAGTTDSWYAFRRYLGGQALDVAIRKDSPKYQIRDLQEMLAQFDDTVVPDGSYGPKTKVAVKTFQTNYNETADEKLREDGIVDAKTWGALLEADEDKAGELDNLRVFMDKLEVKNNRQCARYDGALQGTEVGMTLFYTDLLMKLWSFAYENKLPRVEGFIPETQFPVDPVYWDEIRKYPDTRGWLGGKATSVSYEDDGNTVRFAPTATRLYNASSNPLLNGKEVQPNFSSQRFTSWWNAHYWEVANYEPQYHRLNEIMKWSAVVGSFKDNLPAVLAESASQAFSTNLRFDAWWSSRKDLKVHSAVPFLRVPGETTECMAILESDLFESMGGVWVFSGGVTTFTDKELGQRKLSEARRNLLPEGVRQSGADYSNSEGLGKIVFPGEGEFSVGDAGRSHFAAEPKLQTGFGISGLQARGYLKATDTTFSSRGKELSISTKAGSTALYDLSVNTTATGEISLNATTSDFVRALDYAIGKRPDDGPNWFRVELKEGFMLRPRRGGDWTLFTPDSKTVAPAQPASAKVAIGEKVYTAVPVAEVDARAATERSGWVEIPAVSANGSGGGAKGPTVLVVAASEPEDGDFILQIGNSRRKARLGDEGIMIAATETEADTLRGELDGEDVAAFVAFGSGSGLRSAIRKTFKGQTAYSSFAGAPESDLSVLSHLVDSTGKGRTTVSIRESATGGVRFANDGSLELPSQPTAEQLNIANQALTLASVHPELRTDLHKLGDIELFDLGKLSGASRPGMEAYLELKSIDPSTLSGIGVVDLRVVADNRKAAFRTGKQIGFVPFERDEAVQRSYDYVQALVTETGRPDTVAEFRVKSKPLFDYIKRVAALLDTPKVVTLESGDFDVDAFVLLHGGIPRTRFVRDIPNLQESIEHAAKVVEKRAGKSLILSTVPLEGLQCASCAHAQQMFQQLEEYLPRFGEKLTWLDFREIMEDAEYQQITLIARSAGDGIVFADKWVSLSEVKARLSERSVPHKELLHVITNGRAAVLSAFADSGKFDRVVLSRFQSGDAESFAQAVEEVVTLASTSGQAMLRIAPDDLDSLRSDEDTLALAGIIDHVRTRNGGRDELRVVDLLQEVKRSSSRDAQEEFQQNGDWFREHMADTQTVDLDRFFRTQVESRAKATQIESRKAALELTALPLIKD